MKCNTLRSLAIAGLAWCCVPMASAERLFNQCNVYPWELPNSLTLTLMFPLGDYYAAADAPIGSAIGKPFEGWKLGTAPEGHSIICNRTGNPDPAPILYANVVAVAPISPLQVPPIAGRDVNGKVFLTNVKGVGIAFEYQSPYYGPAENQFLTTSRLPPFHGFNDYTEMNIGISIRNMGVRVALVKIGEIDPGVHTIDTGILYKGDFTGVPNAFTSAFRGTVRQAQCSLSPSNPVSDVPVPLGTWTTNDFRGPGSVTTAVPFHLNLQNCVDDPAGSVAMAHVKLDGALGSTIVDEELGLFSLDPASSASGVGIQILQADTRTPIPLARDVPVARIVPSGDMRLNLSARFYQLPGSSSVGAGSATGALSFTITYQ